jgi:hypothetical protein
MSDDPLYPWKKIVRPAREIHRLKIIDEPHRQVWVTLLADGTVKLVTLLADGTVKLSATSGDPYEYATLDAGELASVAEALTGFVEYVKALANPSPKQTP